MYKYCSTADIDLGLPHMAFIILRYVSSSPTLSGTYMMNMPNFVKALFCISLGNHVNFDIKSVCVIHCIYWLAYVKPSLISRIKPTWIWWMIFFLCVVFISWEFLTQFISDIDPFFSLFIVIYLHGLGNVGFIDGA